MRNIHLHRHLRLVAPMEVAGDKMAGAPCSKLGGQVAVGRWSGGVTEIGRGGWGVPWGRPESR